MKNWLEMENYMFFQRKFNTFAGVSYKFHFLFFKTMEKLSLNKNIYQSDV